VGGGGGKLDGAACFAESESLGAGGTAVRGISICSLQLGAMGDAAVINDFVENGEGTTIPDFAEESFYYVSGIHGLAASIGLTRQR
jgi:hypothetical protein